MSHQSIRDLDLKGKRVFIRVDFNVPLDKVDGAMKITSDKRIKASLPTIQYALDRWALPSFWHRTWADPKAQAQPGNES